MGELTQLHKMDILKPLLFSFTYYIDFIQTLYTPYGRSRRGRVDIQAFTTNG
jgi:hypothetical protein